MRGAEVLIVQNDIEQRPDSLTSGSDHLGQGLLTDFVATVSGMRSLAKGGSNRRLFLAPAIAARRFALILTFTGACLEAFSTFSAFSMRISRYRSSVPFIAICAFFRFVRMWRLNNRFDDSWQGGIRSLRGHISTT